MFWSRETRQKKTERREQKTSRLSLFVSLFRFAAHQSPSRYTQAHSSRVQPTSKVGEATVMEGPPPLLDESSDDQAWIESEGDDEGSGTDESWSGSDGPDVPGSPSWWLTLAAQLEILPEICVDESRSGSSTGSNERIHLEEAASFVLARMKQTESGLQVRCLAVLSCLVAIK